MSRLWGTVLDPMVCKQLRCFFAAEGKAGIWHEVVCGMCSGLQFDSEYNFCLICLSRQCVCVHIMSVVLIRKSKSEPKMEQESDRQYWWQTHTCERVDDQEYQDA